MKIPPLHGLIERRILLNFTADPADVERLLPAPFRPKLYQGKAVVGICLIRLKDVKPKGLPDFIGISSENGAHRIAVEWEEDGLLKEGVYVPRRDTSLRLNALAGGRLFPGKHYLAKFDVAEAAGSYHIAFTSSDGTRVRVEAQETAGFNPTSIFGTLANVSDFLEKGAVGYSPNGYKLEGLRLATYTWQMKPLAVKSVYSSFFASEALFPAGSVQFDNALLMTRIEHEWHQVATKTITTALLAPL
jgi:hypothetical protein